MDSTTHTPLLTQELAAAEAAGNYGDFTLSGTQEKIVALLGVGVTPTQVALATGVSDGYISQLIARPEIAAQIAELRTAKAAEHIEHDASLDSDEELARRLVRTNLDRGFLKPMEVLRHFQVLNAARRKSDVSNLQSAPTATIVNLQLPAQAAVQFQLTVDRQVIEVSGRSMATMGAKQVATMLQEKRKTAVAVETRELLNSSLGDPLKMVGDSRTEALLQSI